VAEAYPDSDIMKVFFELSRKVWENELRAIPTPLAVSEIEKMVFEYVSTF
jgi:nitrogenase subunit NifH